MNNEKQSILEVSDQKDDVFFVDHNDYNSYIGIKRTEKAAFGNHFNGFIHSLQIQNDANREYADQNYRDSGCPTSDGCY
jgi:hypothetical protein